MTKTVLVTGGAGSLGTSIATIFAQNNFRVGIVDINKTKSEILIDSLENKELKHFSITDFNISTMEGVRDVFRNIPEDSTLKVLINNAAGNSESYSNSDTIEERWDKTIDNDLKHVYLMTERAVVEIRKFGGSIVNISSIAGNILGSKSLPYAAAKTAITGLTRSFARIYGSHGIRVNSIILGVMENERTNTSDVEGYFSKIKENTPLRRWAVPNEIAEAVFFIAGDRCGFLHGSNIVIDGGATLTLGPRIDEPIPFKWENFSEL